MATTEPDRHDLQIVHRKYAFTEPLDVMLQNTTLQRVLRLLACQHRKQCARFDAKKRQANDLD
jgi:heme oxygenase